MGIVWRMLCSGMFLATSGDDARGWGVHWSSGFSSLLQGSGIPKPHGGLDAEQSENRLDASTRTGRDVSAVATRPGESGRDPGSHA